MGEIACWWWRNHANQVDQLKGLAHFKNLLLTAIFVFWRQQKASGQETPARQKLSVLGLPLA
jgi:hypothetical protein